jgi:hypothetical protein
MTVEADAIVLGRVMSVKTVKSTRVFRVSRATVRVTRWIYGGKGRTVEVFFHSWGKFQLLIPYKMKVRERVLLFLRRRSQVRHLAPHLALRTAGANEYALQFAKARNVGYKLTVTAQGRLKGFMAAGDPKALQAALRIIKAHLPRKPTRGLRGLLWAHDRTPRCDGRLHLELVLRNTTNRPLGLYTYRYRRMIYVDFRDSRGRRTGSIMVFSFFSRKRMRPPSRMDARSLQPGREYRERFKIALKKVKRARAVRSVTARYNRTPAPPVVGPGPFWVGSLVSNTLQIRCK